MLPHFSGDTLASSTFKSMKSAPRRTLSEFEGEILSFDPPSTPGLSDTTLVDHGSLVGAGSSHNISSLSFQPPITSSSVLGSPFVFGQQGSAARGGRGRSRSHVGASTTLAPFMFVLAHNKPCSAIDPCLAHLYREVMPDPVCQRVRGSRKPFVYSRMGG